MLGRSIGTMEHIDERMDSIFARWAHFRREQTYVWDDDLALSHVTTCDMKRSPVPSGRRAARSKSIGVDRTTVEKRFPRNFSGALRVIHFGRREGSTRGIVGGCRGETKRKRGGGIVIHTAARWAGT